jgi:hypothetical protein
VRDDLIVEARIDAVRLDAARLALLIMRGDLAKYADVRADAYLIADPSRLVTPEHAAHILAEMPKPIECHATLTAGYMGVQFTPRLAPQQHVVTFRSHSEVWQKPPSVFDQLRAAHGDSYSSLLMLCVGAGESRVIPMAAAESFSADFQGEPPGFGIRAAELCLADNPPLAREARAAGAAYVLKRPPGPWDNQIEAGTVITLSRGFDRPSAMLEYTPSVVATCESCGAEPAQWTLSDAGTKPWTERRLGAACAAEVVAAGPGRDIEALEARLAANEQTDLVPSGRRARQRWLDGLLSPWIRLPMPPAVAQAVARLRALL